MQSAPPVPLTLDRALRNLESNAAQVYESLEILKSTGSFYEDGVTLDTDFDTALHDLLSVCRLQSFRQEDWVTLADRRLEKADLLGDVKAALLTLGRGLNYSAAAGLQMVLTGCITPNIREQTRMASLHVLETDGRPEWKQPLLNWRTKAWQLTSHLLVAAYWLDDHDLADMVLSKVWMPSQRSVANCSEVSRIWSVRNMEHLDFEFWRRWWLSALERRPFSETDRSRILAHGVRVFPFADKFSLGLTDFIPMAHAHFCGHPSQTPLRALVQGLFELPLSDTPPRTSQRRPSLRGSA